MTVVTPYPPAQEMQAHAPSMFDQDTADNVVPVGRVTRPGLINAVSLFPAWTRAGTNTNYRTYTLYNRGAAGAGTAVVAQLAATSGVDFTRMVEKVITLGAAADRQVVVGDVLEWVTSATGSGAPDPGGNLVVQQSNG
jgi:hypothetical protein